jgi:hypothetical protein
MPEAICCGRSGCEEAAVQGEGCSGDVAEGVIPMTACLELQLEAKAHVTVQQWIDGGGLPENRPVSTNGILEVHRRFCELLPDDLLWVENPDTKERVRVVPGEVRRSDVRVGQHIR